jgi:two-component system, cell cycle sensor histidine kinase DivJ
MAVNERFEEQTNLAGISQRPGNEMLLSLTARIDVAAVAGQVEGRSSAAATMLQRGFFDAVHLSDRPALLEAVAEAVRSGASKQIRLRLLSNALGAPSAFVSISFTVHPAAGLGGVVAIAKLSRADVVAGDAPRSDADRFLANVSHELRTPLNAILGFSEMLADRELTPTDPLKQREYAKIIHESASHLLALVNLVLDASKVEAGKFELNPEPFALRPLIESCCDMLRLRADGGGVALDCGPFEEIGSLVADKRAVKQIIANLLSNAVKFTPRGGRAQISAKSDDDEVTLLVEDTGVGIPGDLLEHVGEPFFQAHAAYDRNFEGAGLGLSLVRGLVGLHGGGMAIQSSPGRGTRVTVRLPKAGIRPLRDVTPFAAVVFEQIRRDDPSSAAQERKIA